MCVVSSRCSSTSTKGRASTLNGSFCAFGSFVVLIASCHHGVLVGSTGIVVSVRISSMTARVLPVVCLTTPRSCSWGSSRRKGVRALAWVGVRFAAKACGMCERIHSAATSAAFESRAFRNSSVMPGPWPTSAATCSINDAVSRGPRPSQSTSRPKPFWPVATIHGITSHQSVVPAPVLRAKATRSSAVGSTRAVSAWFQSLRELSGKASISSRASSGDSASSPAAMNIVESPNVMSPHES